MVGTFLRHGSDIWLVLGLAALIVGFLAGVLPFSVLWLVVGALTFYVSEYGFHRFSFHAEPSRFAFVRKLQHRLHYDHHAEPRAARSIVPADLVSASQSRGDGAPPSRCCSAGPSSLRRCSV